MIMRTRPTLNDRLVSSLAIGVCWLLLAEACATVGSQTDAPISNQTEWIQIGVTTKQEVIKRYGEPDLVMASSEGETATYRPNIPGRVASTVQIPTVQAGPLGTTTTREQPINPGLGARAVNGGTHERPRHEIHIRYDDRGIVRSVE
jgi:hypothetical protein